MQAHFLFNLAFLMQRNNFTFFNKERFQFDAQQGGYMLSYSSERSENKTQYSFFCSFSFLTWTCSHVKKFKYNCNAVGVLTLIAKGWMIPRLTKLYVLRQQITTTPNIAIHISNEITFCRISDDRLLMLCACLSMCFAMLVRRNVCINFV